MKTISKIIIAAAFAVGALVVGTSAASAAPIECPPGQEAVANPSQPGGWTCINSGGNDNNSEDPVGEKPKGYFEH